jgi:hypothetical protein
MKSLALACLFLVVGCKPIPPLTKPEAKGTNDAGRPTCARACSKIIDQLHCPGYALDGGTCEGDCLQLSRGPIVVDLSCILPCILSDRVRTCKAVDACFGPQ